jgi:hypothetical protein
VRARLHRYAATAAALVCAAACTSAKASPATARFAAEGVAVTVTVTRSASGHATVQVVLAPQRPGFHLYSIALPPGGAEGVGRPIAVTVRGALHGDGSLTTAARVVMMPLAGTGLTLPVYPDGPVTTTLPVAVTGQGTATVLVSYAACSANECMPPVTDHPVDFRVDTTGVTT